MGMSGLKMLVVFSLPIKTESGLFLMKNFFSDILPSVLCSCPAPFLDNSHSYVTLNTLTDKGCSETGTLRHLLKQIFWSQ